MKFQVSPGGSAVPPGTYNAKFAGTEPMDDPENENVQKYGVGVSLKWEIIDGEQAGETAGRICSQKFSPKSNLFKFAKLIFHCAKDIPYFI